MWLVNVKYVKHSPCAQIVCRQLHWASCAFYNRELYTYVGAWHAFSTVIGISVEVTATVVQQHITRGVTVVPTLSQLVQKSHYVLVCILLVAVGSIQILKCTNKIGEASTKRYSKSKIGSR